MEEDPHGGTPCTSPGEKTLRVYACTGELIEERTLTLDAGTYLFDVPCAGMAELT